MLAEGYGGELRAGYMVAAQLGAWRLVPGEDGSHVVTFKSGMPVDAFAARQRPLTLILRIGSMTWTWDDAEYSDGQVRIHGAPVEGVKVLHGT